MATLTQKRLAGAVLALVLSQGTSLAEDIDIYAGGGSAVNPNVLFVIDNSANWAASNQGWPGGIKQGQSELNALRTLVGQLDSSINVGLMMFTSGSGSNEDGAYVRFHVRTMDAANKAALQDLLGNPSGCTNGANSLNGTPNCLYQNFNNSSEKVNTSSVDYSAALYEIFQYFKGRTRYAGNPDPNSDPAAYSTDVGKTNYNSPIGSGCAKNYVIFIGNGFPSQDAPASLLSGIGGNTAFLSLQNFVWDSPFTTTTHCYSSCDAARAAVAPNNIYTNPSTGAQTAYTTVACGTTIASGCASGTAKYRLNGQRPATGATATYTPTSSQNRYADEWARFLNQTDIAAVSGDQNIKLYTIDVFKDQQDTEQTKLLMSMAKAGGGQYFAATSENEIVSALQRAMSEIQSVNSVFASSSLPVSVNTQGTYLNQVFIGMFRPEASAKPRWAGNLKQYQFAFINGQLKLADKNNESAVSSATGFVTPCATSLWSSDTGTYWNYAGAVAKGTCLDASRTSNFPTAGSSSTYSDAPDGEIVEKGGAGQKLRGVASSGGTLTSSSTNYTTRVLKTCDGSSATSCTALTDFSSSNAAVTTALSATGLIDWIRGKDTDDENANASTTEMRPSAHGDVVHSQPAVIDFGSPTGVVAFYGDNTGVFHAVSGGKAASDGNELWGFIAPELYSKLSRQRSNTPLVKLSGVADPGATAKDYFFDGSIGVHQKNSTVWIYPTMRRGGRALYAFDVSTPSSPTLKWRRGCFTGSTTDDSACYTGWSAIGQTWSKPQVGYISGYVDGSGDAKPVLVFGGGYDTCEDTDSQTRCATTPRKGANIWFVDADTGAIIRTYPTHYSVPGDVMLLKDVAGYIKYVYAGDTGGYVYRVNVGSYNGSTFGSFNAVPWTDNSAAANIVIAAMSETNHARKFLFGPDVVEYVDTSGGAYNAVLIGSGDRERPLEANYPCGSYSTTAGGFVTNEFYMIKDTPTTYPATTATPSLLTNVTSNLSAGETDINSRGWRFSLNQCEQVVNKAITVGGKVYFGTNQPTQSSASSCSNLLGTARGYGVDFLSGGATGSRSVTFVGGGLPPSPVAGIVDINGQKVPFIIGGSAPSPLEGEEVIINPNGRRYRSYWFIDTD